MEWYLTMLDNVREEAKDMDADSLLGMLDSFGRMVNVCDKNNMEETVQLFEGIMSVIREEIDHREYAGIS